MPWAYSSENQEDRPGFTNQACEWITPHPKHIPSFLKYQRKQPTYWFSQNRDLTWTANAGSIKKKKKRKKIFSDELVI